MPHHHIYIHTGISTRDAYAPGKNPASHGQSGGSEWAVHSGHHETLTKHGWSVPGGYASTASINIPQRWAMYTHPSRPGHAIVSRPTGRWMHQQRDPSRISGPVKVVGKGESHSALRTHLANLRSGDAAYAPGKNPASHGQRGGSGGSAPHPRVAQHHEFLTGQGFKATNHPPKPGTSPVYKHPEGHQVSVHPQTGEFTYYYGKGGRKSDVNRGGTTHPALRAAHEQRNRVRIPSHRYTS